MKKGKKFQSEINLSFPVLSRIESYKNWYWNSESRSLKYKMATFWIYSKTHFSILGLSEKIADARSYLKDYLSGILD